MLKQKNITREQKKQVNRFLQQIYGFPFKAGGAYLCGAGFEKQGLYTSVYTLQKQALRRIQHSGAAYISLNILPKGGETPVAVQSHRHRYRQQDFSLGLRSRRAGIGTADSLVWNLRRRAHAERHRFHRLRRLPSILHI